MMKLAAGSYWGQLVQSGVAVADNEKKTPSIWMRFLIVYEADPQSETGWKAIPETTRDMNWYLSDGAMPHTSKKLEKIEFNGNFDAPGFADELSHGIELVCKPKTGFGQRASETFEEWDIAKCVIGGTVEYREADSALKRQLTAKFRSISTASKKPSGPPPPTQRPAAQTVELHNDDVPF